MTPLPKRPAPSARTLARVKEEVKVMLSVSQKNSAPHGCLFVEPCDWCVITAGLTRLLRALEKV